VSRTTSALRAAAAIGLAAGAAPSLHVGGLSVASLRAHRCSIDTSTRFVIVVPAHEEEVGLGATLNSLATLAYPSDLHEVVVLADNCTDDTAGVARRHGVRVIERTNPDQRGKGQALNWALPQLLADESVDAIVVVDADSIVDTNVLHHMSWHLRNGADAVQVDYKVRNPQLSWRTRLLDVAFTAQHRTRSSGRTALGLSSGLHGNGMAFSRGTLEEVSYGAFSVVEDIEYGMMLGCAGRRVVACDATFVAGDMPATSTDAAVQRTRWEAGATVVRRRHLRPLVSRSVRSRDPVAAGLAADLVMPPLVNAVAMLGAASVLVVGRIRPWSATMLLLGWGSIAGHVALAISRSDSPAKSIRALIHVPTYVVWKLRLRGSSYWNEQRRGEGAWERSNRSAAVTDTDTDTATKLSATVGVGVAHEGVR